MGGSPRDLGGFVPPPAFRIESAPAPDGALVLVLSGEVDLSTSGEFRRHVDDARASGARALVVDLADVTFVDSTMLRELLRAHADLRETGGQLVLAGTQPPVMRLLELTGTTDVFELAAGRDQALDLIG